GSLINSGASPLGNATTFNTIGLYNITCSYPETQNYTSSSETYWVNVTLIDHSPNVTLISPANGYSLTTSDPTNITFICNATDDNQLQNISLYLTNSNNLNFTLNQTTNISGTANQTNWTLTLALGTYTWNCLAYDNASQSAWGTNYSLTLSAPAPTPPGGGGGGGGGGGPLPPPEECTENWECTSWLPEECPPSEIQTRTCTDLNRCPTTNNKPSETRSCDYPIKEVDLTLIDYPQSIGLKEEPTVKVKVTNTGNKQLKDLTLSFEVSPGWSRPQEVYIPSLEVGETKTIDVKFKNEICSSEGELNIPSNMELSATVEGDGVKDQDSIILPLKVPSGLSVSTDKDSYFSGEDMKVCIFYYNDGREDLNELEFDILIQSLKDFDFLKLDHIFSFHASANEILAIRKDILLTNVFATADYLVKVEMFNGESLSKEDKIEEAETNVFINGFIEQKILGEIGQDYTVVHNLEKHILTVNDFDNTFAYITFQSSPKNYTLMILEEKPLLDSLSVIYLGEKEITEEGRLIKKADIRVRWNEIKEKALVGSAYQIFDLGKGIKEMGLKKGSLFIIIVIWVVIVLIIASIIAISSWLHHHRHFKNKKKLEKQDQFNNFKKKKKR
ncbi:MAG: hypothetical protein KKA62_04520, partial [Nanoarchaeota archaeon]|nr:hypothetical protein [Nanoarchaeota archaeon]